MTLVSKLHQQWLNDPEYGAAYEAQRSEFEVVSATIAAKPFTKQSLISRLVYCVYLMPCGYKAVKIHNRIGMAFFQNNQSLVKWVNQQPLSRNINCLGDGHDGVWNIVEQIGTRHQRREILDWYHLVENLHKVGGSNQRLRRAKTYLWQGLIDNAIAEFDALKKKRCDPASFQDARERAPRQQARNFQNYLRKHRARIPDYQLYQELNICIGSGSVESWIEQIGSRMKIVGAQSNPLNVSQMLKLRCAYLNQDISLSICT